MSNDETEKMKALWSSVLFQAFSDIKNPMIFGDKREKNKELIIKSALAWVNDKKNTGINSFFGICETLELDHNTIREGILLKTGYNKNKKES